MSNEQVETIVAQATAKGQGGVAIVRLSGPHVKSIIKAILGERAIVPRQALYATFYDADQEIIDQGIAIFFPQPNSFTGEDVCELQAHGSPLIVDWLIERSIALGARLAKPGEFSLRAFLNNRIDLTQAEAIADLIQASSKSAARSAMRSLQGEFSKLINLLNEQIIELRMFVEAAIDFSDEQIDLLADHHVLTKLQNLKMQIASIRDKAQLGCLLREGITCVLAGAPNVGKSSLLNCLSGKDSAIVSHIPGTTRDLLRADIVLDGLQLHVVDTAGLRESFDEIEQEGIKRAQREMKQADLVLFMVDASQPLPSIPDDLKTANLIVVVNKIDLSALTLPLANYADKTQVAIAAKYGQGIDTLIQAIKAQVSFQADSEGLFLARRRHLDALSRAHTHIAESIAELESAQAFELAAEALRLAHLALNEITGAFSADDLLGKIFSNFCIGK